MTDERPRLDGRYELGEVIGRGGMSVVHRSYDHRTGRSVAVKIFRPGPDVTDAEQRYLREVTLLAGLRDPGLVTVFDADLDGDMPYLVTELVDGPTLAQRIRQAPLSEPEVITLGASLANTLAYVHEHGIVHRDIKPANILLPAALDDPFAGPKLVDFGIALVAEATRLTGTNLTIGTANYLSPEQLRGAAVTPAADIYSLGLVLIEALTGQPAYPGKGLDAATARLHHDPDIPPCGPPFGELLTEMTALDPEDRPDAGQVARRLTALRPPELLTTELVPPVPLPATVAGPGETEADAADGAGGLAADGARGLAAAGVGAADLAAAGGTADPFGATEVGGADLGAAQLGAAEFGPADPIVDGGRWRRHRLTVAVTVVMAALAVIITVASFTGRHSSGPGPQPTTPAPGSTSASSRPTPTRSPTPTIASEPAAPPVTSAAESSAQSSTSKPAPTTSQPATRTTSVPPTSPSAPPTSPPTEPSSTPPTSGTPTTTPPTEPSGTPPITEPTTPPTDERVAAQPGSG